MKHLKLFNEHSDYLNFKESEDYVSPNVSYCKDEHKSHYYPLTNHEYVDLGLPSGTLWATDYIKNESGDVLYFAWGEAQGYTSGQVGTYKNFSFDDYAFGVYDTGDTINYGYTKYNADDGKTTLDTEDDAAFAYWGKKWRIPTLEQFEELMNSEYTTFTWNSNNNSATFASKANGNSITFLSYGYAFDGQVYYYNQEIATFSKTALGIPDAGGISIWSGGNEVFASYRNLGVPIRPVRFKRFLSI